MRYKYLLLLIMSVALSSCKKEKINLPSPTSPPSDPTVPVGLLKDIVIPNLPSPYYHFEYDLAGKVSLVSFASDFNKYNVLYDGDKISEMRNDIVVNKDRL